MNHMRVTSRRNLTSVPRPLGSGRDRVSRAESLSDRRGTDGGLGFTLVELLVVVTIMLILIAITITAIDFTFNSERVRSGARQVQSALEGARDRAMFAREPRGLRLLVDPDEPRMVTSMIYIGAAGTWNKGSGNIRLQRPDFSPQDGVADSPNVTIVRDPTGSCLWYNLKNRGFLGVFEDLNFNGVLDTGEDQNGNGVLDRDAPRIKIPADDNGTWYTVLTNRLISNNPLDQVLELITPYRDPGTTAPNVVDAFQGGGPSSYLLELPPRVLPDAQPILLPEGIVIDMDASAIPAEWRPGVTATALPLDVQYQLPHSPHMDIMFSPRGTVIGSLAALGVLHLYLGERKDAIYAFDQGVTSSPYGGTDAPRRPPRYATTPSWTPAANPAGDAPLVPGANQFTADNPIGQRLLISIFTQTGKVSTHQINAVDAVSNVTGASGADGYADAPYLFATQGEAQSQ